MTASCLLASTAVDAQRHSAPVYHPPPPPPPAPRYTPPPPPPAANQNVRQGSQSGGAYQSSQQRSSTTGSSLGGYRPGSIANSNSQSSGKISGGASSAQTGAKAGTKPPGIGTTKQAGATGFGKASAANDKGKAAGKGAPKVAAAGAGAGLFAAGGQQAHAAPKSSVEDPFRPDLKGKAKNDFNNPPQKKAVAANKDDGKKKGPRGPQDCGPGEVWDAALQRCVPKPANDLKPR